MLDPSTTHTSVFALGLVLAWLAGVRVYLTVFGIGIASAFGWMGLPPALQLAASPWVIGLCGVMAVIEFGADKIPGVDTGWDLLHTLLRVPAGAFLAAAAMSPDGSLHSGALIAGGALALTSHGIKTGTRALINTSPEPLTNWSASASEDAISVTALVLLVAHPWLALSVAVGSALVIGGAVLWIFRAVVRRLSHRRPETIV